MIVSCANLLTKTLNVHLNHLQVHTCLVRIKESPCVQYSRKGVECYLNIGVFVLTNDTGVWACQSKK